MAVSVLVVDDSPIARKMLIKALPPDWDIEITQASNGIDATAYRAGRVDVMFLDLTMPDMDATEVETLRKEDLNCLVIVVSADVQEKAQERVLAMGAIAFIRKPITAEGLRDVLKPGMGWSYEPRRLKPSTRPSPATSATRCRRSPTSEWARPARRSQKSGASSCAPVDPARCQRRATGYSNRAAAARRREEHPCRTAGVPTARSGAKSSSSSPAARRESSPS